MTREQISKKTWTVKGTPLTGEQVLDLLDAAPDPHAMCKAVGLPSYNMSSRLVDRALTILRRADLLQYNKDARQWERIEQRETR